MRGFSIIAVMLLGSTAFAADPPAMVHAGQDAAGVRAGSGVAPDIATRRGPTENDVANFIAGQSIWIAPDGQNWQLESVASGKAHWVPYAASGKDPAALVSGIAVCASTRRIAPAWAGNLFIVQRATDLATQAIKALPNGDPDVATLAWFLEPSLGIGYVTTLKDQCGGANDITQPVLAAAPKIDMASVTGSNIPLEFDGSKRNYDAAIAPAFAVTRVSGATVTMTPPVPAWVLPGLAVTATNIPAEASVVAVNHATGAITLNVAPAATPGRVKIKAANRVYMDIPNTAAVPWRSWSTVMAIHSAMPEFAGKPVIWGVHGADVALPAGSWAGAMFGGLNNNFLRIINGASGSNANGIGAYPHSAPQVFAISMGGAGGRDLTYQLNGVQTTAAAYVSQNAGVTLAGGAIGNHSQFTPGTAGAGGFLLYDFIGIGHSISAADMTLLTASIDQARGWKPQQQAKAFTADGSSTTIGGGTLGPLCWPFQVTNYLRDIAPMVPFQAATGGTMEQQVGLFGIIGPARPGLTTRDLLINHFGQGNSLQVAAVATVTGTDTATGILTLAASTRGTVFNGIGARVTGNANMSGAATITAYDETHVTIAPPPTGPVATLTVVNDTARDMWNTARQYMTVARAAGYKKIVLIGSASRGTFKAAQLAGFSTWKVFLQENWRALGADLYVDLEDSSFFGDDGGTMTVSAVNGRNVTVNAASAYAVLNSRVRWSGMPYSIANDTGGQTITNVEGNVLTVSDTTTGLAAGSTIRAVNPTPWFSYPAQWSTDTQHFYLPGYQVQGSIIAQGLIDSALLP